MGHYSGGKYVYDFGDEGNGLCERTPSNSSIKDKRIKELEEQNDALSIKLKQFQKLYWDLEKKGLDTDYD
jgi:hypothetical protein